MKLGKHERVFQDFPCPIILGQWKACNWTGKGVRARGWGNTEVTGEVRRTKMALDMDLCCIY